MLILVCGSRDYNDYEKVNNILRFYLNDIDELFILQGGAKGADALAKIWANSNGVPCVEVSANWGYYDKAAGPIRNKWMLMLEPDLVIAFPGGPGTANMITQAKRAGVEVIEVE